HVAVGVPCGVMDQVAVLEGRAGHAVLLDCAEVTWRHVRIPDSVEFAVVDTATRRALDDGRYALRRAEAERAVAAARGRVGAGPRELRPGDVDELRLDEPDHRRLRHVVTENV